MRSSQELPLEQWREQSLTPSSVSHPLSFPLSHHHTHNPTLAVLKTEAQFAAKGGKVSPARPPACL